MENKITERTLMGSSLEKFRNNRVTGKLNEFWNDESGAIGAVDRIHSSILEAGAYGKIFTGGVALAAFAGSWYFNAITSAQGLAGEGNIPNGVALFGGATMNVWESVLWAALLSSHGIREHAMLSSVFGKEALDKMQKSVVYLAVGAAGVIYSYDWITTFAGMHHLVENDISRAIGAGLLIFGQEIFLAGGERLVRAGLDEKKMVDYVRKQSPGASQFE